MKLFYGIVLVLMIFVSACAQQPAEQAPVTEPEQSVEAEVQPQPEAEAEGTGAAVATSEVEKTDVAPMEGDEETTTPATGNEVRMFGVGQYDPEEVTISVGGSVTFINEGNFKSVVTIKGDSGITNTPIIEPGDKYEQEFAEDGEYDAWAVAYGPGVKITVE
jgi:plastocyanin